MSTQLTDQVSPIATAHPHQGTQTLEKSTKPDWAYRPRQLAFPLRRKVSTQLTDEVSPHRTAHSHQGTQTLEKSSKARLGIPTAPTCIPLESEGVNAVDGGGVPHRHRPTPTKARPIAGERFPLPQPNTTERTRIHSNTPLQPHTPPVILSAGAAAVEESPNPSRKTANTRTVHPSRFA